MKRDIVHLGIRHRSAAATRSSKQAAVLALLRRPSGTTMRPSWRRPAGRPIRCAASWPGWCARSSLEGAGLASGVAYHSQLHELGIWLAYEVGCGTGGCERTRRRLGEIVVRTRRIVSPDWLAARCRSVRSSGRCSWEAARGAVMPQLRTRTARYRFERLRERT
jgi:hypothetical protein